ncbi:MAG TPA: hypothetical protein VFB67_13460 [Candidatus Polarisedimenticolaceae bacterium]|nr:hypothetical protein [Candidatus Polarisedimenticolaceae bacterium]
MRWIVGSVLAGLAMFTWGAISHMALPLGTMGMRGVPADREVAVVDAMKGAMTDRAIYMFPSFDPDRPMTQAETDAYAAKLSKGPTGLVVYNPGPGAVFGPGLLLMELLTNILSCLVAAWVLLRIAPATGFLERAAVVAAFGAFATLSIEASYWNWYKFPASYFAAQAIDQIVGAFLAGLVLAAIVKRA